jgi:hypothetical protein
MLFESSMSSLGTTEIVCGMSKIGIAMREAERADCGW